MTSTTELLAPPEDLDDLEHTCDGQADTPNDCAACQMEAALDEARARLRTRPRHTVSEERS